MPHISNVNDLGRFSHCKLPRQNKQQKVLKIKIKNIINIFASVAVLFSLQFKHARKRSLRNSTTVIHSNCFSKPNSQQIKIQMDKFWGFLKPIANRVKNSNFISYSIELTKNSDTQLRRWIYEWVEQKVINKKMTRGKRAYPNHKKEHKKLIKFASRWHTLQIVQNEKITLRSR